MSLENSPIKKTNKKKSTKKMSDVKNIDIKEVKEEEVSSTTKTITEKEIKNIKDVIKETINKEKTENNEKKIKTKFDISFNKKINLEEIFDYIINNDNITPKMKNFAVNFKKAVDENKFDINYFINLSNLIHNYKLVIAFLTYCWYKKEVEFEINSILEIPKNLINNNKHIFDKTKFELNKKNIVFNSNPISINEINVEKNFPFIDKSKYLLENTSENNMKEFIVTIYITWLLCIIHIHIFNNLIEELIEINKKNYKENPEENLEVVENIILCEKHLEKFISINNDTNIYIKPIISFLKKKTIKNNKKNENKQEKIINQDISSIENVDIHENNLIKPVNDDSDDDNSDEETKSIKNFNISIIKDDSDNESS